MELFTHLLVPTDGSALSLSAARRAVALAAATEARVTFFHALPEPRQRFFGGEGGGFVDQMPIEEFRRQAQQSAEAHLDELRTMCAAARVACDSVIATPALETVASSLPRTA